MNVLSFDIGIKNLCYCTLNSDRKIVDWKILNISNDVPCCHLLRNKTECGKGATHICGDKYLCNTHSKHKSYGKVKKFKNKKNSLFYIGQNLIQQLSQIDVTDVTDVIVENQPSLKNPTMKSIQMIVYSYFLMNGVCNRDSKIERLEMINARNKLKVYKGEPVECDIKDTYKRNKWLAVEYCKRMIVDEKQEYIDLYNESKKKDDLSDSYLQGIYYIDKI